MLNLFETGVRLARNDFTTVIYEAYEGPKGWKSQL